MSGIFNPESVPSGACDLVVMPYHDYRKSELEGFRGRDADFLELFIANSSMFRSVLIIDRPTTVLEMAVPGTRWHVRGGKIQLPAKIGASPRSIRTCTFSNHLALSSSAPLLLRHAWWDKAFASKRFAAVVKKSVRCAWN